MGDFNSPVLGHQEPHGDFKGSIYSAWDRGAKSATYVPLDESRDVQGHEMDNISLDSLQMPAIGDQDFEDAAKPTDKQVNFPQESVSRADVTVKRTSWLSVYIIILSVYSTLISGLWLGVAIAQPRWGHAIQSGGSLSLSTANLLTVIFAKTIELSFVTIFVAFIGQSLTKKAIHQQSDGLTKADMAMRSWILQPGSMLSNGHTLRYAGASFLGVMTLVATIMATFYTTASDTMVRPKLRFSDWHQRDLQSYIMASYANVEYVKDSCATPITTAFDPTDAGASCVAIQDSGNSYHNLLAFMSTWRDISYNGSGTSRDMAYRPISQALLYDNVSMSGSWVEVEYSDPVKNFETHKRIINNVSLALPHPGKSGQALEFLGVVVANERFRNIQSCD